MNDDWLFETRRGDETEVLERRCENVGVMLEHYAGLQGLGFEVLGATRKDRVREVAALHASAARIAAHVGPNAVMESESDRALAAFDRRQAAINSMDNTGGMTAGYIDPIAELSQKVDELITSAWQRRGVKLSESDAAKLAYDNDPGLWNRVRQAYREQRRERIKRLHPLARGRRT